MLVGASYLETVSLLFGKKDAIISRLALGNDRLEEGFVDLVDRQWGKPIGVIAEAIQVHCRFHDCH